MATDIDELQIQIQGSAKSANSSVTALIKRLEKLSNVINGIDAKKVNNLGTGLNSVGKGSKSASAGLDKTATSAKKATSNFNSLASAFGKFYATYFLFIRGAKSVWKGIESSMDYVETSNYFSVALGEIGKQFEEAGFESAELYTDALVSELSDLNSRLTGYTLGSSGEALFSGDVGLGMDIEQLMNFQAKTLAVTNSVGLMGDASVETAKAVSMLAGDLSSLTNTDLETVMTNLSSGLIGQSRSLYKYGVDITQNTLQQYALAEGIEKAVSEMTQAEKMQLRLLTILDQSDVSTADLANTINSVANQYRVFDQQIDNTGRTLGNLFLPIVQNVLPWVNGLIIAINNLLTSIGFEVYGENWLKDLQEGISGGAQEGFEDLEGSVDDATDSLNKFKKSARGFDELNILTGGTSVGSGVLGELEGQIDLTDRISDAVTDYENAWNDAFSKAENKANEFAETLTNMFEATGAVENFSEIVDSIKEFNVAVSPFAEGFGDGFLGFFGTLAETSLGVFTASLDVLSDVIGEIEPETLKDFGEAFGVLVGPVASLTAMSAISDKFKQINDGLSGLGSVLVKHPILGTFAISAGVVTLIETLFPEVGTNYGNKSSNNLADNLKDVASALEEAEKAFREGNNLSANIETVYDKWKLLNDQVELTIGEQGLLKEYADYLKLYCEGADQFIDENGKSFENVGLELEAVIEKAKLYYQTLAHEDYLGKLTSQKIETEYNLKDARKEIDSLYSYIREKNKSLTDDEIQGLIEVAQNAKFRENIFGSISGGTAEILAFQLGITTKDVEEFTDKVEALRRLGQLQVVESETESQLQKINTRIEEVTAAYSELNAEYKKSLEELEKLKAKNQETADTSNNLADSAKNTNSEFLTAEEIWRKAAEKVKAMREAEDKAAESTLNLGNAAKDAVDFFKKLNSVIDEASKKEINIPVTIGGGGSGNGLELGRNILSPNLSLRAYAGGGMVTAGEVFVARENGTPELVGNFGGQVGVANNQQIVSAIEEAAYRGYKRAIDESSVATPHVTVKIGENEVGKASVKYIKEESRKRQKLPFPFYI